MTKRSLNLCHSCGSTWYPRGQYVSAKCPRCGSSHVETAADAALRELVEFVARIFETLAAFLVFLGRCLVLLVLFFATCTSTLFLFCWNKSEPARAFARKWGEHLLYGCKRFALWVGSVREDLLAEGDVNPVLLVSKLLILVCAGALLAIGVIKLFR